MTLVSGDLTQSPLGSDKEEYDDETEIVREGQDQMKIKILFTYAQTTYQILFEVDELLMFS